MAGTAVTRTAPTLLWGMQATMLPLVATVGDATMNGDRWRHLYVLPAFAALAGYGAWRLLRGGWRWTPPLLVWALLVPTLQSQLLPCQFTYKDVAAGPVDDRWEPTSTPCSWREAITRVPASERAWCYARSIQLLSASYVSRPDRGDRNQRMEPFMHEQVINASRNGEDRLIWVVGRKYRGSPIPVWIRRRRPLRTGEVTMAFLLLCDPVVYDSG